LDSLVNLEELWLGKNKITKLEVVFLLVTPAPSLMNWYSQNFSRLKRLKILSLQSNRITVIEGLEELTNLEELYLSHNGVKRLEGLDQNVSLLTVFDDSSFIVYLGTSSNSRCGQ